MTQLNVFRAATSAVSTKTRKTTDTKYSYLYFKSLLYSCFIFILSEKYLFNVNRIE